MVVLISSVGWGGCGVVLVVGVEGWWWLSSRGDWQPTGGGGWWGGGLVTRCIGECTPAKESSWHPGVAKVVKLVDIGVLCLSV